MGYCTATHNWYAKVRIQELILALASWFENHSWPRPCPTCPLVCPEAGLAWLKAQGPILSPCQSCLPKKYCTFSAFHLQSRAETVDAVTHSLSDTGQCFNTFTALATRSICTQFLGERTRTRRLTWQQQPSTVTRLQQLWWKHWETHSLDTKPGLWRSSSGTLRSRPL